MNSRIFTIVLAIALVLSVIVFLGSYRNTFRMPGNHEGYEPVQPIPFSHRLHAGELAISCTHCHTGAEESRHASIPPVGTCMNCHSFVSAPFIDVRAEHELAAKANRPPHRVISPEIQKIHDAVGVNEEMKPIRASKPIEWVKVHNVPDFVYFNHSAHVNAGVDCQTCHGAVETMERVRQVNDLSMGWCVNCHRDANARGVKGVRVSASTDCVACHY